MSEADKLDTWAGQGWARRRSADPRHSPRRAREPAPDALQRHALRIERQPPRAIEPPGGNGGALGHYGLFQFDVPTWQSEGGHGHSIDAPPEEQLMRAVLLYQRRGFRPWVCANPDNLCYV